MRKVLGWIVLTGAVAAVLFVTQAPGWGNPDAGPSIPHAQLELDRAMAQQMAVVYGPGMDTQMESFGMLQRSSSDVYLDALEEHTRQFDRMLGTAP